MGKGGKAGSSTSPAAWDTCTRRRASSPSREPVSSAPYGPRRAGCTSGPTSTAGWRAAPAAGRRSSSASRDRAKRRRGTRRGRSRRAGTAHARKHDDGTRPSMTSRAAHAEEDPAALRSLLEHLKSSRGFDFTGYKRSSLERRIRKRMVRGGDRPISTSTRTISRYTPDEFTELFNTILINVTGFFRDEAGVGLPGGDDPPSDRWSTSRIRKPIRIWYGRHARRARRPTPLAILFAEALGEERLPPTG